MARYFIETKHAHPFIQWALGVFIGLCSVMAWLGIAWRNGWRYG